MLTSRQADLLGVIGAGVSRDGVVPTYDEMRVRLGLRSKSGVHRLVVALEERGYIRRIPNRARAIELLREVPGALAGRLAPVAPVVTVPLLGTVTRDGPFREAPAGSSVRFPLDALPAGTEVFALFVRGAFPPAEGLLDGDELAVVAVDGVAGPGLHVLREGARTSLRRIPGGSDLDGAAVIGRVVALRRVY